MKLPRQVTSVPVVMTMAAKGVKVFRSERQQRLDSATELSDHQFFVHSVYRFMRNTLTILVETSLQNGGGRPYLTGFLLAIYFLQLPCIQWRPVFHHGDCAILLNLNLTEYEDLRKFLLDLHQFRSITTVSGLPIQNLNILLYDFVLVAR